MLMVDSEEPVDAVNNPWQHLDSRDRWARPDGAGCEQVCLKVACVEAWLVADVDTLAQFFGNGFRPQIMPNRPPEEMPKATVYDLLERATEDSRKGPYGKSGHSFALLG